MRKTRVAIGDVKMRKGPERRKETLDPGKTDCPLEDPNALSFRDPRKEHSVGDMSRMYRNADAFLV